MRAVCPESGIPIISFDSQTDYLHNLICTPHCGMAVQSAVSEFCNGISSDTDDAVVEYLTGVVDDACNDECADIGGIEELVQGFLPDIAKLSQQERHERLWTLLTKVHIRA